jgi:hypothetical protein
MHIRDYVVVYDRRSEMWELRRSFDSSRNTTLIVGFPQRDSAVQAAENLCERIAEKGYAAGLAVRTESGAVESNRVYGEVEQAAATA